MAENGIPVWTSSLENFEGIILSSLKFHSYSKNSSCHFNFWVSMSYFFPCGIFTVFSLASYLVCWNCMMMCLIEDETLPTWKLMFLSFRKFSWISFLVISSSPFSLSGMLIVQILDLLDCFLRLSSSFSHIHVHVYIFILVFWENFLTFSTILLSLLFWISAVIFNFKEVLSSVPLSPVYGILLVLLLHYLLMSIFRY